MKHSERKRVLDEQVKRIRTQAKIIIGIYTVLALAGVVIFLALLIKLIQLFV